MVMAPLKKAFEQSVHALGLKTFTPEKWEPVKHQYGL
jgi:acid stress-induced BolA-like protein IbaG/YrbA